jgi:hypothetical protein
MARLKHILSVSVVLTLLVGFGWNVAISEAHPSGHSHEHIFSSHSKPNHSGENSEEDKFYCPKHKHYSSLPCPRLHTQEDMAHPEHCKIGPECGRSSQKSLPLNSGADDNRALNNTIIPLDPPEITHSSPHPNLPWLPLPSL